MLGLSDEYSGVGSFFFVVVCWFSFFFPCLFPTGDVPEVICMCCYSCLVPSSPRPLICSHRIVDEHINRGAPNTQNRDLACGLSFLCCGSKSSKLAFAYSLFGGGGRAPQVGGATEERSRCILIVSFNTPRVLALKEVCVFWLGVFFV